MKNQGISLISLIITIIVIIILAAIVIFTGLNTPDSAQFANFTNDVDSVYTAMINKFGDLKVKHAVANQTRTNEQIFLEIAIGSDQDQYNTMNNCTITSGDANTGINAGCGYQHIDVAANLLTVEDNYTLPDVRQYNTGWYVTEDGKVFNANGFVYDGKTYFTSSVYAHKELAATKTAPSGASNATDVISARANKIAPAVMGSTLEITTIAK